MKTLKRSLLIAFFVVIVVSAMAHFQLMKVPDTFIGEGDSSKFDIELIFTHPGGGSTENISDPLSMNMGIPEKFGVWNKGEYTDLTDTLVEYVFTHGQREAVAYKTSYRVRGMGDFVFTFEPAPYWEENEGKYITQYSKLILNRAGLPTDWSMETGMLAEIVPLTWPVNIFDGSTFRGVVLYKGEPVPNAEIEVEFLNAKAFKGAFADVKEYDFEDGESPAQLIMTDENGVFSFSFPWSGWWGFASLLEGDPIDGKDQEVGATITLEVLDKPF